MKHKIEKLIHRGKNHFMVFCLIIRMIVDKDYSDNICQNKTYISYYINMSTIYTIYISSRQLKDT